MLKRLTCAIDVYVNAKAGRPLFAEKMPQGLLKNMVGEGIIAGLSLAHRRVSAKFERACQPDTPHDTEALIRVVNEDLKREQDKH